ncbi:MAG: hypothetical protein QOJ10_656 [Chloroflexota bacterium]|nr:hypothetical protein [Chloroflexota bacterium]
MRVGCGGGVSGPDHAERLIALRNSIDLQEIEFSRIAGEFAQTDEYDRLGFDSPISWIKENCHMTGGAAADRVCAGEQKERLVQSVAAVALGEIGFAHFALLARTSAAVGGHLNEAKLLRQAANLSVARFRNACMHARHAADPDGYVNEEREGVEARSLVLTATDDGVVVINGILDKEGGAALRTALEPLAKRAGKDDDRNRERRMADALVDLSMHALDSGLIPQQASQRTHMQVTTTLETLMGLDGAPAAELEFSLPISAKAVERLACDCSVTRILLGSDSMVIDVGRAKRVISGPQRKALNARDRGCVWPGCERPASWTSGHHLVHWFRGGGGGLPNLALLCYRHHWMVHEGNWQMVRTDDGSLLTIPPTMTFGPPARGPD